MPSVPFSVARDALDRPARGLGRAVGVGEGLDQAVRALAPVGRDGDAVDARRLAATFTAIACGSPLFSTSTTNGFITPGEICGVGEHLAAVDRVTLAGEVLRLRLARVQLHAVEDEHRDDREPGRRHRHRDGA